MARTGYWLLDNPNPNAPVRDDGRRGWFHSTRREAVSGAIAVHSTEGAPDYDGPDYGAENTARYFTHSTRAASYHRIVDSDSIVRCMPLSYTAFHDATGGNPHAMSVSFGTQAHTWGRRPDHDEAMLRNGARALAEEARYWASLASGRDPMACARWITPAQYRARQPGLCEHGELDPGRRSDRWTAHRFRPEFRARLVAYMAEELGADSPPKEDEMTPAQEAKLDKALERLAALEKQVNDFAVAGYQGHVAVLPQLTAITAEVAPKGPGARSIRTLLEMIWNALYTGEGKLKPVIARFLG